MRLSSQNTYLAPSYQSMSKLPEIKPNRLAIKVKSVAERAIRKGHPWVFESAISKQSGEGQAGDLAIIYDGKKNKFLAVGLWDPNSPIRIKVLQSNTPANINEDWFNQKVAQAKAIREPLLKSETNSYRLLFGENDKVPGLICDVYSSVVVVKIYSAIWFPYLKAILPAIVKHTNASAIVLRMSRNLQKPEIESHGLKDGDVLYGTLEKENVIFTEHGLQFYANVIKGHKTGYFLDHRHNRKKVGELAEGKAVLDIFSYAGGFTVHALAGGAKEVISLDISRQAQELAKENVRLNNLDKDKHQIMVADAFKGMQALIDDRKQFDIVVVDPPSFAKSAADIPQATKSYERLTRLAVRLVKKSGILLSASCSSRIKQEEYFELIEAVLDSTGRRFKLIEKTDHDVDHPIGFAEGGYLKSGYYQLD